MKLLQEKELIWSAVVANTRMNRSRNASGVNSYEQELPFRPEQWLEERIARNGTVKWMDLCCGEGKALVQAAAWLEQRGLQARAHLRGIDLIGDFPQAPAASSLEFKMGSIVEWQPDTTYDLITCVHGLHYVGDKLQVIRTACSALREGGLLIADLDLQNIKIEGMSNAMSWIRQEFRRQGLDYDIRKKRITSTSPCKIDWS